MRKKSHEPKRRSENEIVLLFIIRESQCTECAEELRKGSLLRLEGEKVLCMSCADLDRLDFLPSGDTTVTRQAARFSKLRAVVVRWSRARKRYERQGILVEPDAIARAEEESIADADLRARRQERAAERREIVNQTYVAAFAGAIRQQYTGCPEQDATEIAQHACRKHSGRVGRTAAAKDFGPQPIRLALIAHIRHAHTNYDELLVRYGDRQTARD